MHFCNKQVRRERNVQENTTVGSQCRMCRVDVSGKAVKYVRLFQRITHIHLEFLNVTQREMFKNIYICVHLYTSLSTSSQSLLFMSSKYMTAFLLTTGYKHIDIIINLHINVKNFYVELSYMSVCKDTEDSTVIGCTTLESFTKQEHWC